MFLSLIEWRGDGMMSAPITDHAREGACLTRQFRTEGVMEDCMIWSEYDTRPYIRGLPHAKVTLLQKTQEVGQAGPLETPFVYLVHTDIEPELLDEYNAWYGEEHLPHLVKVPGILRARRFSALAGAPHFLTAYDLTDRHAFESPEGLVARKTPWTERMRSQFKNTRRIMCMT